jgi:hypothetical protein
VFGHAVVGEVRFTLGRIRIFLVGGIEPSRYFARRESPLLGAKFKTDFV